MKTLINLIGGQTIPNLIAQKYIKPQKIILLFSKGSEKQKNNYINAFNYIEFESIEINPFDYNDVVSNVKNIVKNNTDSELILNFTGGTKIMSLASFQVFKEKKLPSIYVDSENDKIYVYKDGLDYVEDMNINITAEEYLKLNGHVYHFNIQNEPDYSRKKYYEYLEENYTDKISRFLTAINEKFEENKKKFYKNNTRIEEESYKYLWDDNLQTSIITLNNHRFEIKGKDSIKYITGLWFEDLVYYKKFSGTNYYNEIIRNVHIQDKRSKQDMIELDVIGLFRNNLHLFEFKSGKPRREAINNLRTIKEQLGTYTKLFLISYFDLPENDPLIERMRDLGITFFKYSDFTLEKCFEKSNINL